MKEIEGEKYFTKLKNIIIFKYLRAEDQKKIFKIAKFVKFQKSEKIISKGEVSPYFYAVIQGTVNVIIPEKQGKSVFICAIGSGDVFGEAGIFLKVKRTADVISSDTSTLLMIHRQDIITFLKSNPEAGSKILMLIIYSLLRKLKEANQEIAFERKANIDQSDIDIMVEEIMKE